MYSYITQTSTYIDGTQLNHLRLIIHVKCTCVQITPNISCYTNSHFVSKGVNHDYVKTKCIKKPLLLPANIMRLAHVCQVASGQYCIPLPFWAVLYTPPIVGSTVYPSHCGQYCIPLPLYELELTPRPRVKWVNLGRFWGK